MDQAIFTGLCETAGREHVYQEEPLSRHTTFRIGGPADYFVAPESISALVKTVAFCREREIPFYILGNGSNLLVGDKGYRGVIIQLYKNLNQIRTEGEIIRAQSGAMLSAIARTAMENGLTGLEFASGIPGTLGGAVVMNAGAYGGEMKDVIRTVRVLSRSGKLLDIPGEKMEFGYRTSVVGRKQYIVLEAELKLCPGDREEISFRMKKLQEKRVEKQPLNLPSAGSTFKRPEGYFAGKLIMDAGLRGFSVGGAQISEKHCGFVVNKGQATAADVRELMRQVSDIVQEKYGVLLEPEVKMLGEF